MLRREGPLAGSRLWCWGFVCVLGGEILSGKKVTHSTAWHTEAPITNNISSQKEDCWCISGGIYMSRARKLN